MDFRLLYTGSFRPSALIFIFLVLFLAGNAGMSQNQDLDSIIIDPDKGLMMSGIRLTNGDTLSLEKDIPLYTFLWNNLPVTSSGGDLSSGGDTIFMTYAGKLATFLLQETGYSPGLKYSLTLMNHADSTQRIENVLPFGEAVDRTYILPGGTYNWPDYLSRARLHRPGKGQVGVVLPDNAWHLGYCDIMIDEDISIVALARRTDWQKADARRWWTDLEPGGSVTYNIYIDLHGGNWQDGLELIFRNRYLYDLEAFDNSLYMSEDLSWMRHKYIMLLQFAWDHKYYDYRIGGGTFDDYLFEWDNLIGGYDIFTLWPTWPRLGLDERNQWDMYRDLPGGIEELKRQADILHQAKKKFFISYNPWDESTRKEDHLLGMEKLLRETDADGIVLDTRGESSYELQRTADNVRPGIIMYSEGMAVPENMPGIVSGRVHDALYMPPPLNLNKFIKPDFAIFRVLQLAEGPIHREIAVSFFNGYGVEINTMRPGRPDWIEDELKYLGRTTKLLRENTSAFCDLNWKPLVSSLADSIWVNEWNHNDKTIYTILSLVPEGYNGPLIEGKLKDAYHVVSLWNHQEVLPKVLDEKTYFPVDVEGFSRSWLGTRRESTVECIAVFPRLLDVDINGDFLSFHAEKGDQIVVYAGDPWYDTPCENFSTEAQTISLYNYFGAHEEKFVVQLFENNELLDERVLYIPLGTPRLISQLIETPKADFHPEGMVEIPAGNFDYFTRRDPSLVAPFIPYPHHSDTLHLKMKRYFMDEYPVTNLDYWKFISSTGYIPDDTCNFLKHWVNGKPEKGAENHPVVYISLDDAVEYARWAEKRLPTEIEWQYAAQGDDGRIYPWGDIMDSTLCNFRSNKTTPVDQFQKGKSPFGVKDLVGNVWQLTSDVYDNGSYYFEMIRGGSYYYPSSSIWYVNGGPVPVNHPQILILVSPCLDRCATLGFRCVKDSC